jgi:molybdopterin-containing oxidoreductase family membrane subunit
LFLLYSRSFPVIAQAEVKTILKASGDNYKKAREENDPNHSDNH